MRALRLDITGATDANGNASIPIKLPQTGQWHVAKFSLSIPGPAEWAILVSGSVATYGRGRRVTLGPELVQDGETVTVSVTGGPVNAAIIGGVNGISGTSAEMLAAYTPQPNTISLDALATTRQIDFFNQAAGVVVSNRVYTLPTGTQNVRLEVNSNQLNVAFTNLKIIGGTTGIVYVFPSSNPGGVGGFDEWFKPAPPDTTILFSLDSTGSANPVEVVITADLAMNFVIAALTGAGTSTGSPLLVENTTLAPWQAAGALAPIAATSINSGASLNLVAAAAGKTVYLHGYSFSQDAANAAAQWQLQDTSGAAIASFFDVAARHVFASGDFKGAPITAGRGVQMVNGGAAASFLAGFLSYAQQ